MMRNRNWLLALTLAATLATACSKSRPDAVFLIVVDTLRPDRLSCYGYDRIRTPAIDSLAAAGVRFRYAQSVASWAIPSMGAIMTSRYPTQLGLVEAPVPPDSVLGWRQPREQLSYTLDPEETTLAELMKQAGYRTAAFVDQPGLNASDSFVQGFDDWYYPEDIETIARYAPDKPLVSKPWTDFLKNARLNDSHLIDTFAQWLGEHKNEPVFAWIHLLTPHHPYNPPPWTAQRSSDTRRRFAPTGPTDGYNGEVVAVDDLVRRVVSLIDAGYGRERSVVVFVSDNGEAFGEHRMVEHGHTLHSENIHVPLIIRAPGATPGTSVNATVRTIDILPTILELTGASASIPAGTRGESLVPMFNGAGRHRPVYSEAMLYGSTERSLMVDGKKLMIDVQVPGAALYDEMYDPQELVDISSARTALVDSLLGVLTSFHAELEADYLRRAGGREMTPAESDRMEKAMRSLGYVGGTGGAADSTGGD